MFRHLRVLSLLSLFSILLLAQALAKPVHAAARISLSPASVSLTEGEVQEVTVTLDEPIICNIMDETCNVTIEIDCTETSRFSLSSSTITIPYSEWALTHSFTISATDNDLVDGDVSPECIFATSSNSEYYQGFTPTFALSIADNDAAAAQSSENQASASSTSTKQQETLPATGLNTYGLISLAMFIILGSLAITRYRRNI